MSILRKFRKRPVVIEAIQYFPDRINEIWDWAGADNIYGPILEPDSEESDGLEVTDSAFILTMEGRMECRPGSWIIKGVSGEFYPCDPSIFEQTYEEER